MSSIRPGPARTCGNADVAYNCEHRRHAGDRCRQHRHEPHLHGQLRRQHRDRDRWRHQPDNYGCRWPVPLRCPGKSVYQQSLRFQLFGNDPTCQSAGTVTVIDGSNHTTTVNVGASPYQAAINTTTNKIYVANSGGNTVTIIDGATNNTSSVTVGNGPSGLAVNMATNKIYVPNFADGTVTVIDGTTLTTTTVSAEVIRSR